MSDGVASYPKKEINDIKKSKHFKDNKIKFSAIGYGRGNGFKVLEDIANALGGKIEQVVKPEQLKMSYIRLVSPSEY